MKNENSEPSEFESEIRAAFDAYPRPTANAEFDAKFWRELDARGHRYRGFAGALRRLIEVEIEGIAVWRLGLALFGGAATCAVGVALLSLASSPVTPEQNARQIAQNRAESSDAALDRALCAPRYASGNWDEAPPAPKFRSPLKKEVSSCAWFAHDLA